MRIITGISAVFLISGLIVSCTGSPGRSEKDVADIRQLITEQFKSAWDDRDVSRIASFFTEDADLTLPVSGWISGRVAISEALSGDNFEGINTQFEIKDIRFPGNGFALVNMDVYNSITPDGGRELSGYRGAATALLTKEDNAWKYLALRIMPGRVEAAAIRDSIESAWNHYIASAESEDTEEVMKIYAPDLLVIGNGLPEQDYDAIREHYLTAFEVSDMDVKENKILEFEVLGQRAVHRGIYHEIQHWDSGEVMDFTMNYYAVWVQQPDDSWKIKRLMFTIRG